MILNSEHCGEAVRHFYRDFFSLGKHISVSEKRFRIVRIVLRNDSDFSLVKIYLKKKNLRIPDSFSLKLKLYRPIDRFCLCRCPGGISVTSRKTRYNITGLPEMLSESRFDCNGLAAFYSSL